MDSLVMKLPSSSPLCAVVLDWFDSRERSEARDGHQFQPGGPVDRLQVSRGQEARESSCWVPSGAQEWSWGRSKVRHVNPCEGLLLCVCHIDGRRTSVQLAVHVRRPVFHFLLLFVQLLLTLQHSTAQCFCKRYCVLHSITSNQFLFRWKEP